MSTKRTLYIGIDGGASSSKLVLIDSNEKILSKFVSGSCNKNNIGFENACKNISDGITGLLTLAKKTTSNVAGLCMTTAGCTMIKDKIEWKTAISKILNDNGDIIRIEVHNDSVGDVASVCPKTMCGIVCIVGTGFIVCGYNGDPNIEYRAGGWGPLFGDNASGYFIGEKVLKAAALYYDICGNAEKRYTDTIDKKSDDNDDINANKSDDNKNKLVTEYGGSKILYTKVMNKAKVKDFGAMVDWAYNAKDKYKQVAECTLLAIESYNECIVAKNIIDNAVNALILRLLLILNKMYPKETFDYNKKDNVINIICGGSILLKSELFLDLFKKQLMWKLGGDGRQTYIQFVKPQREPQLGGALYIKNKCETS
eukprot:409975_1